MRLKKSFVSEILATRRDEGRLLNHVSLLVELQTGLMVKAFPAVGAEHSFFFRRYVIAIEGHVPFRIAPPFGVRTGFLSPLNLKMFSAREAFLTINVSFLIVFIREVGGSRYLRNSHFPDVGPRVTAGTFTAPVGLESLETSVIRLHGEAVAAGATGHYSQFIAADVRVAVFCYI